MLAYLPYLVGALALVGYALFVLALRRDVDAKTTETEWLRLTYLFTGVESIAFAAAGFFFGREVNRARAEQAEKHAASAEKHAKQEEKRAQDEAERAEEATKTAHKAVTHGRTLALGLRAATGQVAAKSLTADAGDGGAREAFVADLARQAERMFPPD